MDVRGFVLKKWSVCLPALALPAFRTCRFLTLLPLSTPLLVIFLCEEFCFAGVVETAPHLSLRPTTAGSSAHLGTSNSGLLVFGSAQLQNPDGGAAIRS